MDHARTWRTFFAASGGLLAFWGLLAALYLQFLRVPQRTGDPAALACDFGEIFSNGACTSIVWMPIFVMILGGILATVGLLFFRPHEHEPADVLRAGAGTHFFLAALASLFVVPGLYLMAVAGNAGDAHMEEWIRLGANAYDARPFLGGIMAAGLLSFIGAIGVHAAHEQKRRRFLQLERFRRDTGPREEAPQPRQAPSHERPGGRLPPSGFRWDPIRN